MSWVATAIVGTGIATQVYGAKKSKSKAPPKPVQPLNLLSQTAPGISDYYRQYVLGPSGMSQEELANLTPEQRSSIGGGLAALNRQIMQKLSPEQAAAVSRGANLASRAEQAIGEFGLTSEEIIKNAEEAMRLYGSKIGEYKPTITEEQAQKLYNTKMAQQMAEEAFARRGVLSLEEQRYAQQQAREAAAASGRIGGNAAIASEIMNRESALAARRGEASILGQAAYAQGMGALQQRLQTQQGLFNQILGAGQQQGAERQLGFNQMLGIGQQKLALEQQKTALAQQAMQANLVAGGLAQDFYTTPGLNLFAMPLNFANQQAGAENQYNKDVTAIKNYNRQLEGQMWGNIGSTLLTAGLTPGVGTSLGNFGSFLGSGNTGNASTALGNVGLSALGQPMRAYTV